MKDLIAALTILLKYGDHENPTGCEHDVLYVYDIDPHKVSQEDLQKLDDLGFHPGDDNEGFTSYKYGSA